MDTISTLKYQDKLRQRREQVSITLKHIETQQKEAGDNTDWLDQAAYESRMGLLDRLTGWYRKEMADIVEALERIAQDRYGLCLACHNAIEAERLDSSPQTAFCSACQATREGLQNP